MEELPQQKSIDWAKEVGITQIITATLGGGNNPTLDQVKKAADEYNKIAAASAAAGLQQGPHNEGFIAPTRLDDHFPVCPFGWKPNPVVPFCLRVGCPSTFKFLQFPTTVAPSPGRPAPST